MRRIIADATISGLEGSKACLYVRGTLFNLKTNANNVRVTEAFMDDIVNNKKKYIGDPLCADVKGLTRGKVIDHRYNELTDTFTSQIIGSIIDFEKEETEDGARCVITAKILKRYRDICEAISSLFATGDLKFSFEVLVGEWTELEDGCMLIDASEKNYLEGAAIVTYPACEEAVAMQLIAECLNQGDENMNKKKNEETIEVTAENENVAATTAEAENTTETPTEETHTEAPAEPATDGSVVNTDTAAPAESTNETPTTEQSTEEPAPAAEATAQVATNTEANASTDDSQPAADPQPETEATAATTEATADAQRENAALYVTEENLDTRRVHVYDTVTEASVTQESTDYTRTEQFIDNESFDAPSNASNETAATNTETTASENEVTLQSLAAMVQSLASSVDEIRRQIAEANKPEEPIRTVAEAAHVDASVTNPFMSDINVPKKWTLLDKQEKTRNYSLLDKA